jgi:hypothetical protein
VIHAESVKALVRSPVHALDSVPVVRSAGILVRLNVDEVTNVEWQTHLQFVGQAYLSCMSSAKRRGDSDAVTDVGQQVGDLPMHLMHHSSLYHVRGKVRDILKEQIANRVGLRGQRHVYVQLMEDLDAIHNY